MKKAMRWALILLLLLCLLALFSALLISEYIKTSTRNRILSAESASAVYLSSAVASSPMGPQRPCWKTGCCRRSISMSRGRRENSW